MGAIPAGGQLRVPASGGGISKIMDDEESFIRIDGAMISEHDQDDLLAMSSDESRVNLKGFT
jgi:hypothetical protein